MKMGVGLMLVTFGTFWAGEGVHVAWPGSDLAIPVLVAFTVWWPGCWWWRCATGAAPRARLGAVAGRGPVRG